MTDTTEVTISETLEPTLLQQLHNEKKRMRTLLPIGSKHYTGEGIKGGYLPKISGQRATAGLKVSTFNVRGLTREKLALLLQFIPTDNIDVLTCIDSKLTVKSGQYFGKMVTSHLCYCTFALTHISWVGGKKR